MAFVVDSGGTASKSLLPHARAVVREAIKHPGAAAKQGLNAGKGLLQQGWNAAKTSFNALPGPAKAAIVALGASAALIGLIDAKKQNSPTVAGPYGR